MSNLPVPASDAGVPSSDPEARAMDALVAQAGGGDATAFTQLVRELHPRVFRWALAFAADADEAEDVAQEAFVIALRRMSSYRGPGTFAIWMYHVTRRAAGQLRRTRRRRALLASKPSAMPDRMVYETDPGGRVDQQRLAEEVRRYWQQLPERQRAVIDLVDLQGYTPAMAADMLDLNHATLRANLFKARQAIRQRLIARFGDELSGAGR